MFLLPNAAGFNPLCAILRVTGNNRSHALNATKRRFLPNLHSHRFWVESEKRFVTLRVSAKGMRVIDKKGIDTVLAELRARGEKY